MRTETPKEADLRAHLLRAVSKLQTAVRRCPAVTELDVIRDREVAVAERSVLEVSRRIADVLDLVSQLERLDALSADGVDAARMTRATLALVQALIAVVTAAIDCRAEAA